MDVTLTFVQGPTSESLKLSKVVDQVAVLVFWVGGHVVKLPDVALPNAEGEDLHAS